MGEKFEFKIANCIYGEIEPYDYEYEPPQRYVHHDLFCSKCGKTDIPLNELRAKNGEDNTDIEGFVGLYVCDDCLKELVKGDFQSFELTSKYGLTYTFEKGE